MSVVRKAIILLLLFTGGVTARDLTREMPKFWDVLQQGAAARCTLQVVDDDGGPVADANVQISYMVPGGKWIKGLSNSSGHFSAEGLSLGEMRFTVKKEGFYKTSAQTRFELHDGVLVKDGKWQPWNPETTVVLRRIINPIPMYARKVETKIPALDDACGFDLVAGDWVEPYGKGILGDIQVALKRRVGSIEDYEGVLTISFQGMFGGIQRDLDVHAQSGFLSSRIAPPNNYIQVWTNQFGYGASTGYFGRNLEELQSWHLIRVRTDLSEAGELRQAMYGKMNGAFQIRGIARTELPTISFTYYLNPTPNDRNMEFDPKRNLFKSLDSLEEVIDP